MPPQEPSGLLMIQHPSDNFALRKPTQRVHGQPLVEAHEPVQLVKHAGPAPKCFGLGKEVFRFGPRRRVEIVHFGPLRNTTGGMLGKDDQHGNDGCSGPAREIIDVEGKRLG